MKSRALLFLVPFLIIACSIEKKAKKSFQSGKYQTAIDLYKKTLESNPNNGRANYFVAESYRLSNRVKDAEPFYEKAGGPGINKDSVKFYLAQSLKANGKYDEAYKHLEQLSASAEGEQMKDRASAEIQGIAYIKKLSESTSYYRVKNLETVNTPAIEYAPVFLNNELYFTSSRGSGKIFEANGTPFTKIYKAQSRGANVDVSTIQPVSQINTDDVNDGTLAFSPDGKIMVFGKGNSGRKKDGFDIDLYIARFRNGEWQEPLPININTQIKESDPNIARVKMSNYSWDSTPAFSLDGRTLYFASNREGGYGGTDLYSARMDSRGRFSRVKNLGPEINTSGNEMFPYVAEDGSLYFASDGHPGFGGLDLFSVKRINGKNTIENLGLPMNSNADDFGIFLFRPDRGFFTSNREGGMGDDDIYTFVNEDPNLKIINYYLQGITYTPNSKGELEILPNTKVSLSDSRGEVLQDYVTGNDGKFLFRVYENEDYDLIGETEGYLVKRQLYSTKGRSVDPKTLKDLVTNITLDTLLVLDKIELNKIFALDNIYFDFDKYDIRADAAKELDKLVQVLIDNPEIKIEMGSHTDSVGTHAYNIELSQNRAQSTVNYLIKSGISPDRLTAKGYGEEKPIARNTNPDGTDNPAGRDKNRRTEFKILEIGVMPKPISDEVEDFDEDKYFKKDGN